MKRRSLLTLLVSVIIVLAFAICARPTWVSDDNTFLKSFVSQELLSVLAVIVSISVASLSQAHLTLNRIEERRNRICFPRTRREIREAAVSLIILFAGAFVIVMVKPLLVYQGPLVAPIANASAISILALSVLILLDITTALFGIKPELPSPDESAPLSPEEKSGMKKSKPESVHPEACPNADSQTRLSAVTQGASGYG